MFFFTEEKKRTMKSKSLEAAIAGGSIWRWFGVSLLEVAVGRARGLAEGLTARSSASALPSCRTGLHLSSKGESRTGWSNPPLWTLLTKCGLCPGLPLGICLFPSDLGGGAGLPTFPPKYDRFGSIPKKIPKFCFLCGGVSF